MIVLQIDAPSEEADAHEESTVHTEDLNLLIELVRPVHIPK